MKTIYADPFPREDTLRLEPLPEDKPARATSCYACQVFVSTKAALPLCEDCRSRFAREVGR